MKKPKRYILMGLFKYPCHPLLAWFSSSHPLSFFPTKAEKNTTPTRGGKEKRKKVEKDGVEANQKI